MSWLGSQDLRISGSQAESKAKVGPSDTARFAALSRPSGKARLSMPSGKAHQAYKVDSLCSLIKGDETGRVKS